MRFVLLLPLLLLGANGANAPREVPLELKRQLIDVINRDRVLHGLRPVEFSEVLSQAADAHCREMLVEDYMSHWNRAGWKPYVRYSRVGIRDFTAENVWSLWKSHFDDEPGQIWNEMLNAHRSFMAERPPNDGHRQAILGPRYTHVGIGAAFHQGGMRLVQLFASRYVELTPLPDEATLSARLQVSGRLLKRTTRLFAIGVYYEPLPFPMSPAQLKARGPYSLPNEEHLERVAISHGVYVDGSRGTIEVDAAGQFRGPVNFWKRKPGLYTVAVWLREEGEREGFIGALATIFVKEKSR